MSWLQHESLNQSKNNKLIALFDEVLSRHLDQGQWAWVRAQIDQYRTRFSISFATAPLKIGKKIVELTDNEQNIFQFIHQGFHINGWSMSRIFRVRLLLQLNATDQQVYIRQIEQLFRVAEMNELVALYSALPLLAYPETWRMRCAEGIRSNISDVLRAIICNNPYPADQLEEGPWNQLVLKAFFVALPVEQIIGLQERMNARLADTLSDYRDERRSAGREVHPLIDQLLVTFHKEKENKQHNP
ncbi:hypothetical protein SAMN05216436_11847 [bacterium A37T11]|nr:hypothetical protein SAMN05216436_11847 [bacterium A37T11]